MSVIAILRQLTQGSWPVVSTTFANGAAFGGPLVVPSLHLSSGRILRPSAQSCLHDVLIVLVSKKNILTAGACRSSTGTGT
jgi:hypothetical protein